MRSVAAVLLAALAVPLATSAGTNVQSGLRGSVVLDPARPVCREDESCTKPARAVALVFARDGRVAARVTTSASGTYRVLLRPGRYVVSAPSFRVGSGVTPAVVRVRTGVVSRVDLRIDTGLQ